MAPLVAIWLLAACIFLVARFGELRLPAGFVRGPAWVPALAIVGIFLLGTPPSGCSGGGCTGAIILWGYMGLVASAMLGVRLLVGALFGRRSS